MSTERDFDRTAQAWLADGPTELADRVLDAALREVHTTSQRPRLTVLPWRTPAMNTPQRVAAGIAIVAVLGFAALSILGRGSAYGGVPTPIPTPTTTATQSPAPSLGPIDTSAWTTYTSSQYGFSIGQPPGWTAVPANRAWSFQADAENWLSPAEDAFLAPDASVRVAAWAVPLTAGQLNQSWPDVERWVIDYCERTKNTDCTTIHDRVVPLCIEKRDCHPALLVPFADDVQAFGFGGVLPDGMMLVVTIARGESDPNVAPYGGATRLLEAFLSTMNVWPPFYPEAQDAAATFVATGK